MSDKQTVEDRAQAIVDAVLDGETGESMLQYGWVSGTADEFSEFWLEGAASDELRRHRIEADYDRLCSLVGEGLADAYSPHRYDPDMSEFDGDGLPPPRTYGEYVQRLYVHA